MALIFLILTAFFTIQTDSVLAEEAAGSSREFKLDEILSEAEYRNYERRTRYRDRMDVFRRALDRQGTIVRSMTRQNRLEEAAGHLQQIRSLVEYIREEPVTDQRDLRSRQVKRLEIHIRRFLETLRDLQASVPSTEQDEFEETSRALETLRSELLSEIFGHSQVLLDDGDQALGLPPADPNLDRPAWFEIFFTPARSASLRVVNLQSSDRFTDQEFTKLQNSQNLVRRVDVFLEIAESRLDEIVRRRAETDWEEGEENPLEFYTYAEMIHAYERAIEGIMINIDERARYRTAESRDIRRSLERLNAKIGDFIHRLDELLQFSVELQDREFHDKLRQAIKTSDQALKGSQLGLGAPVN